MNSKTLPDCYASPPVAGDVSASLKPKPPVMAAVIFGGFVLALAWVAALQSGQSEVRPEFWLLAFGFPFVLAGMLLALAAFVRAWRAGAVTGRALRRAALDAGALAVAGVAVFGGVWRWLHPPGIRYAFSAGQSGSWAAVQFFHTEHGREIPGPWVGNWPMRVRFPDLNGDGFPDLRVLADRGEIAEFVYLPQNDGKRFWQLVRAHGFQVSYPPDGHD